MRVTRSATEETQRAPGADRGRGHVGTEGAAAGLPPALYVAFGAPTPAQRAAVARSAIAGSSGRVHPDHPEVVVHDDAAAHRAAARIGAHGFTIGSHVVLGTTGPSRDAVLHHELRHARQVDNCRRGAPRADGAALEREAEAGADPQLGADPDDVHGLFWVVPIIVGGYILLDPDPANAPGPGDPVYPAKNPAQRVAEGVLLALPAGRLAAGGAGVRTMMMWGGGSALGSRAVGDLGRGDVSDWNEYVGTGMSGAIGWGLPMGPMRAFGSGARGLPLFGNFMGYGTATGLGLRASHDVTAWDLSSWQDYALWSGAGFAAGTLGASVVTGLDFVATVALSRSNAAISRSLSTAPEAAAGSSQTIESLQATFARRPDLSGRLAQCYLDARSLSSPGNLWPREGTVNVGGGQETPQFTNLNPFVEGTGGPTSGVPNHVRASFEQMELVFEPGTVTSVISNRLPAATVNWPAAAEGAYRVMAPGGTVQINVWSGSAATTDNILRAFRTAGFSNVRLGGELVLSNGRVLPLPTNSSGSGVIISAVR